MAEEDKGPCREKPGTEELGKSRKSQGEMRGSDRDENGGGGGRERQMHSPMHRLQNWMSNLLIFHIRSSRPRGGAHLAEDTQEV